MSGKEHVAIKVKLSNCKKIKQQFSLTSVCAHSTAVYATGWFRV
jgi:hypothetical protein